MFRPASVQHQKSHRRHSFQTGLGRADPAAQGPGKKVEPGSTSATKKCSDIWQNTESANHIQVSSLFWWITF